MNTKNKKAVLSMEEVNSTIKRSGVRTSFAPYI